MFFHAKGDTTGRVVTCCLLTALEVILEDGSDPFSHALAPYFLAFIVPSQHDLKGDQSPLLTLYVLELKMS